MELCPLCRKAEPVAKTEYSSVSRIVSLSVSVSLPDNVCGRCGIAVADAALLRAHQQMTEMKARGDR